MLVNPRMGFKGIRLRALSAEGREEGSVLQVFEASCGYTATEGHPEGSIISTKVKCSPE